VVIVCDSDFLRPITQFFFSENTRTFSYEIGFMSYHSSTVHVALQIAFFILPTFEVFHCRLRMMSVSLIDPVIPDSVLVDP